MEKIVSEDALRRAFAAIDERHRFSGYAALRLKVLTIGLWLGTVLAFLGIACFWTFDMGSLRSVLRENAIDFQLSYIKSQPSDRVVVVDIDSEALRKFGQWPWRRSLLANLISKIGEAQPVIQGLDILLAGPDRLSPAAIARQLALDTGRSDLSTISDQLEDGDISIAEAVRANPCALGAVFGPHAERETFPTAPLLLRGELYLPNIWAAEAATGPPSTLARFASGIGLIVFENDDDGVARRVPLLGLAGGVPVPGLAVELVRILQGASALILDGVTSRLHIGDLNAPLGTDAKLRFRATPPESWRVRTISAADIFLGTYDPARLSNHVVLIGSSAPEVGIMRRTARSEAAPTVQIQADATATLLDGPIPVRPGAFSSIENVCAFGLTLLATLAALSLRLPRACLVLAVLDLSWLAVSELLLIWRTLLLDPVGPPALASLIFSSCATAAAVRLDHRERKLRRRFEQHLPADVISRLLARQGELRLDGETREVTALFTDVEGFTELTERVGPRQLIRLLDEYFQTVIGTIVLYGGMVDKIVGDAVHALFNAPLDLPNHAERAVECAVALSKACEEFRSRRDPQAAQFGRTRIGIESGNVVVGDVGGGGKLDYTAHGTAINTAARLEAANKLLRTTICIGPMTAKLLPKGRLRSLGTIKIQGRADAIEVFEPFDQ